MSAADRQSEERDASPSERSAASEVEAVDAGRSALFPASPPSDQGWNTTVATATPVRALAKATAAILSIRIIDSPLVEDYWRVGLRERSGAGVTPSPAILHHSRLGVSVSIRRSAAVIEGAVWPAGAGTALTGLRVHDPVDVLFEPLVEAVGLLLGELLAV